MSDEALLRTKLRPPPPRRAPLPRPRLHERLERGARGPAVLVQAPAGYGKTTLLAAWASERAGATAWLGLDEGDNAPRRFLAHLAAAMQGADATLAALGDIVRDDPREVAAIILDDALDNEEDVVLVLDDLHEIDAPEVLDAIAMLVDHAPERLHIVLASRGEPALPLARWRAEGAIEELRVDDLRFGAAEALELSRRLGLGLEPDDAEALVRRVEGWAAGLQLAALSLRGRSADPAARRDYIERFTGTDRHVLDYLAEEVLVRRPPDEQEFLLRTSVLDDIDADLAEAVTGRPDAGARLEALERDDLFLHPLEAPGPDGRRRWRYHASFRDLLRRRLDDLGPGRVADLHLRAAERLRARGREADALRQRLRAGDLEGVARELEGHPRGAEVRAALHGILRRPDDGAPLLELLRAATGVRLEPSERARLLDALEPDDARPAPRDGGALPLEPLSERELEVLRLVAAGSSNKEAARRLDISDNTVKTHLKNAYAKLAASNRTEAASRARELGLI